MKSKVEEKISKLLEMAYRGTKHEKQIALVKAQKLMLDHHMELKDFKVK